MLTDAIWIENRSWSNICPQFWTRGNSLKEIGSDINHGFKTRAEDSLNSFSVFANYLRFSFPSMEVIANNDGTSHKFLHTDSGDVYRLKASTVDGVQTYSPEGQTIKDVVVKETSEFSNGQTDGTSKFVMTGKDGKKTYFAEDGRLLGIRDRYGNTIVFEYTTLTYTIDGQTITKKLMSKITDTIGRVTTIEYKEDTTFTVGPIKNQTYAAEESYKASQNPNNTDSGDLQGKFQVIVHVPGDKKIVYDKSAVLVNSTKHVMRTRLQRVFDVDDRPKYHFWYEQPDLGFTYMNGTQYAAYNRYENLTQIDYSKTNHIKRYLYNSYTKQLNKGSMQYRKVFEKKELVKTGYDPAQSKFEDRFIVDVRTRLSIHIPQYVIVETDASDHIAVRYVRGINYIARMDGADKLSYYLFNGHGDEDEKGG